MAEGPGIIGGLPALIQGLIQGRQASEQIQDERANRSLNQAKGAEELLPIYQQLARVNPQWAQSPGAAQAVNSNLAPIGVNMGNQLPQSFGQVDSAQLLSNPSILPTLQSLDPATRSIFKGSVAGIPDSFWSDPSRPTPQEALSAYQALREQYQPYAMGWMDPNSQQAQQIRSQMQALSQFVPGIAAANGTGAVPQADPNAPQTLGVRGQNVVANTNNKNANTELTKKKTGWLDTMNTARLADLNAATNLKNMQSWAIPKNVQARLTSANASAQRADDEHTKTVMAVTAFNQLGTSPAALSAYTGMENSLQKSVDTDRLALSDVQKSIDSILQSHPGHTIPADSIAGQQLSLLQQKQQNLNKRYNENVIQLQKFQKNRGAFAQQVMRQQGAPGSWQNATPKSSKMSGPPLYMLHGKPIWLSPNGNGYVYADGTPAN